MLNPPRVAFIALDAFPFDRLSENLTPTLARLAREGGYAPQGGISVLSASTYPNFASLITGARPDRHRIFTGHSWRSDRLVPAAEAGPATRTLFEEYRDRSLRAVAAVGDQNLIGVCGAAAADTHWPPEGRLPESAPRGRLGYGADRAVVDALDRMEPDQADFLFVQLDEVDTARHLYGPWSPEVETQCRDTDGALGEVLERLEPRWSETIVVVVSDHDHEAVEPGAVDLAAHAREQGLDLLIDHDGTAAVISGRVDRARLLRFPGVIDVRELAPGYALVWGAPGQQFGVDWKLAAQHGSPRTARQLAVVGGGHPAVGAWARRIRTSPPDCTAWAGWIRDHLEPTPP